ncbi:MULTISPECIES: hypothetical protein [unclassified Microcoleus]|uniref:hypothetical protein n=1 Tax=unclassified Microcoleus TaxID=2642155 RepID=UPI002FD06AEC
MCIHSHNRASQTAPLPPLPKSDRNPKLFYPTKANVPENSGVVPMLRSLAVSDAYEQVRALAGSRLHSQDW